MEKFLSNDNDRTLLYDHKLTQELFSTNGSDYYNGYEENALKVLLAKGGGQKYLPNGVTANEIISTKGDWFLSAPVAILDGYDLPEVVGTFTYCVKATVDGNWIRYEATNIMGMQSYGGGNLVPGQLSRIDVPASGPLSDVAMNFSWSRQVPAALRDPNR